MFESLAAKLIAGAVALIVAGAIGAGTMYKIDQAIYQTLETKFANYQTDVAKAEAKTRINDLAAQQKFAKTAQAAVDAANARAAKAEQDRAAATQALDDILSKEGQKDPALGVCLAKKLPSDVLNGLAR